MKLQLQEGKLYYSIGEVAKAFNVNVSLIRFWENEFSQVNPKKNKKGNRCFGKKDIQTLKMIYQLVKVEGYTLEGAKNKLTNTLKGHQDSYLETIEKLESVKQRLEELLKDVQ